MEEELRNAKLAIKEAITRSPLAFTYLNDEQRNDEEIAKHAIKSFKKFCETYARLPSGGWDHQRYGRARDILQRVVSYIGQGLKTDKSFVPWAIDETDGVYIREEIGLMSNHLKDDEDVILAVVEHYPEYLSYASERLKDHKAFLRKLLGNSPWSVDYISDRLKDDVEFLRSALADSPIYGPLASSERLKDNDDFVFWGVSRCGDFLYEFECEWEEFASDRLRNDRDFILRCVEANPHVLGSQLPARFLDDETIVFTGVTKLKGTMYFEHISSRLKLDKQFVLRSPVLSAGALQHGDPTFKKDSGVVLKAMSFSGELLKIVHPKLKADKNIVLAAIQESPLAFRYVADELKSDVQIVELSLRSDEAQIWPQQQDWSSCFKPTNKKLCVLSDNLLGSGDDTLKSLLEDRYLSSCHSKSNKRRRAKRETSNMLSEQWERVWLVGQLNVEPTCSTSNSSLSADGNTITTMNKIKSYPGIHRSIAEFAGYKNNIAELKAYGSIINKMVEYDLRLERPSTRNKFILKKYIIPDGVEFDRTSTR